MTRASLTIAALGLVQILTWSSSFYLIAVLGPAIAADTLWPLRYIMLGLTLALLASGLSAFPVSRLITSYGGRVVIMGGTGVICLGLLGLAASPSLPVFLLAWVVIGFGMAGALYEAAFSTLTQIFGAKARRAITLLTLWGGFASTIGWPLTALLIDSFGWRGACLAYVALHLCVTLPLCWFGLPKPQTPQPVEAFAKPKQRVDRRFYWLAWASVCLTFVFVTLSANLIVLLAARDLTLASAVGLAALIGPAQVGARLLDMAGRGRHPALVTLTASAICILSGVAGLWWGGPVALCLILYGAGSGLWSIARGTVPLAIWGPAEYPALMARLAMPTLLAAAVAPILGAVMISDLGADATLLILALVAAFPFVAAVMLWRLNASHDPVH